MKKFLVIALLMCGMCAQALVIEGGVHYTVESARDEAFSKVQYTIPMEEHAKYLTDPGFSRGKDGKPKIRKFGRKVTFFSDGSYGVEYLTIPYAYYYDKDGCLEGIETYSGSAYPRLTQKYNRKGELIVVFYSVNKEETFSYGPDKQYGGRWIGEVFYDVNGEKKYYRYQ